MFTLPARLCTDPAVFVVASMPRTLVAAGSAGDNTSLKLMADHRPVRGAEASHDAPGGHADVGAVEVEHNAVDQRLDIFFVQACVRTDCADLGAIRTGFNTGDKFLQVFAFPGRMAFHHSSCHIHHHCVHDDVPPLSCL
jgi:hypothetical protein